MLNDATCFKAVYIVCGYTDLRAVMDRLAALVETLKDFSGICVTDGYQVCHPIEGEREDLRIAGCWSHYPRSIVILERV